MSVIKQYNVTSGKGTLYNGNITIIPPKQGMIIGNYCAIGPNLTIVAQGQES